MKKSDLKDYPEYFNRYLELIEEEELIEALENSIPKMKGFLQSIPEEKYDFRYQPEKWTIKEVFAHMLDGERIFNYRALRFARNDTSELPGFDQNEYMKYSNIENRKFSDLINEFSAVRRSTIELFKSFSDEMLLRKGIANKREMSVLLLGFLTVGHGMHHMKIIKERYL